jgi:GNAT superfamily N-acetyltransferase
MDDPDYLRSWGCALEVTGRLGERHDEPSGYITEYDAVIRGDTDHVTKIGTLRYLVIDLAAAEEEGIDPMDVLDSHDSDLAEFVTLVNRRGFVPSVAKMVGEYLQPILIIERIEIDEAYRGHDLGLTAISIACEVAGLGCCLAALVAFPSQWHGKSFKTSKAFVRDRARLARHYEKAGFRSLRRAGIMVRPILL